MHASYLDAIKRFEGFTSRASWDYAQYTNGFGTRAAHAGEVIDRAEAERRFQGEIAKAAEIVDRVAPGLDAGTRAALTSLTFNAGTKWINDGLGQAVKEGRLEDAQRIFLQYTKAGGEDLSGLVKRRLEEATWFASVAPDDADPAAPAPTSGTRHATAAPRDDVTDVTPARAALAVLDAVTLDALSLLDDHIRDRRRSVA